MAVGYIRQALANIAAGLPIQSSDINNELNQLQSAFDNTTGHDHTGSATGTGAKINLATGTTGSLTVATGGTGLTSGTSGGILGFTGTTSMASSGLLTQHALVLGGGAGVVPSTPVGLGTTTTVLHGNAAGAPSFGAISLTADVTGSLPIANGGTAAATAAGAFANLVVQAYSLAQNGDVQFKNGLIFQWGRATIATDASAAVSFPQAMPTATYIVVVTRDVDSNGQVFGIAANSVTTSGFTAVDGSNVGGGTVGIYWFAVGV